MINFKYGSALRVQVLRCTDFPSRGQHHLKHEHKAHISTSKWASHHPGHIITFLPDGEVTTFEFFKFDTLAIPPAKESGSISAGTILRISDTNSER